MGTFRFLLAFAVLMAHIATEIGPSMINRDSVHILVWSGQAVIAFFVISGFYMSLIINEKYARLAGGTRRFYLNRALRLYPIHWTILGLYAVYFAVSGTPSFLLGDARVPFWRWLYAIISNVSFLGVEVLPFFGEQNWTFVLGPVWSLGIELWFYLLAPFVVTRRLPVLMLLFGAATAFRLILYVAGVPLLPWRYFFFPANLTFFLMGSLSYRLYAWAKDKPIAKQLGWVAAIVILVWTVTPALWTSPDLDQLLPWCFYVCVAVCIPFLFSLSSSWRIDSALGKLSYPIYLSHIPVIYFVVWANVSALDKGVASTLLTLTLSAALYAFIDRPIERVRERIKEGATNVAQAITLAGGWHPALTRRK
jgi:peptidoglycan/LPS O-acetylase OafA/YrhL